MSDVQRIAVISSDNNSNYFYYLPIVAYYWNKFGWDVHAFVTDDYPKPDKDYGVIYHRIPLIENVRPGTCAQTVRHFAANVLPKDSYIMVQDIDLIPLKPYDPDLTKKTIYGWELTGHSFIPVHYTGMMQKDWMEVMDCTGDLKADMEREIKANGRAYGEKWEEYWDTDWDILTTKVKAKAQIKPNECQPGYHHKERNGFRFVERGMVQVGKYKLPKGRVDRASIEVAKDGSYSWGASLNQPDLIDCHCENNNPASPEKWAMIRSLLVQVFGDVPKWMDEYTKEFHAKYGI